MRCADTPALRELADQLLAYEEVERTSAVPDMRAVIRVCGKLHRPLATLAGPAGFRSLLGRALHLAKQECPDLGSWAVRLDASLQVVDCVTAQSGAPLIAHLLGLMMTLVGESLTLKLLREVWPSLPDYQAKAARKEPV